MPQVAGQRQKPNGQAEGHQELQAEVEPLRAQVEDVPANWTRFVVVTRED